MMVEEKWGESREGGQKVRDDGGKREGRKAGNKSRWEERKERREVINK